jgi:hypothetical protein
MSEAESEQIQNENEQSAQSEQTQNVRSTQSIIDGLNQGSLVTESIKTQQAEIMRKMEETVKAAQQRIKIENAQIKKIITTLGSINSSIGNLVNQSNSILQNNKQLIEKAIRITQSDISDNTNRSNDIKLKSLLNSLKEYNNNKITEFNQIGNVYMSFMKDVYTMAGLNNDNIAVPDRKNDAFSDKIEEDAGLLSKLGTGIGSWFGFGGSFNISEMREAIKRIHTVLLKRKELIQRMIVAIKEASVHIRSIIEDIETIRKNEKTLVLSYLNGGDKSDSDIRLESLYKIPMKSISQISSQFGVLVSGMLNLAAVDGTYETAPAVTGEKLASAPAPAPAPVPAPAPKEEAPSFWSNLFGPASPTTSSPLPSNESIKEEPDKDAEESEVCENIDDNVKNLLNETENIQVPTQSENLSDKTCNDYREYEKKIQDIKGNITYNSCNSTLKRQLTKRQNKISGIIATHCDNTTRRSSRLRGGGSHSKTLKNRHWYMQKAKKHVKGKRKYPSRS